MKGNKKILIGVTKSDVHSVSNQLIALYLKGKGFEVINIGVNSSVRDFADAYLKNSDVSVIAIGNLNGQAYDDLRELATIKSEAQITCPVVLGGIPWVGSKKPKDLEEKFFQIGVDYVMESAEEFFAFLEKLES